MNGIVGVFDRSGADVDVDLLDRMMARIGHRGRDGSRTWIDGSIALGQQTTHTTPKSKHESLPIVSGSRVLVADARIDNRGEILRHDGSVGERTLTDCELLFSACDRWGVDSPSQLVGAFAFARWSDPEASLLLARDHLGIRPLYYAVSEDQFAFASEPKCLRCVGGVTGAPDDRRIANYLVGDFEGTNRTFYRDIKRIPPGHELVVTEDEAWMRRYWAPDPSREIRLPSDAAYERRFREIFAEAVRCRLRRTGTVGTFLSGGIDSSSITGVAHEILAERDPEATLHTFSAIFEDVPACDEREYIEPVLERGTFDSHFVHGDRVPALKDIESHVWHQDSPFYPSLFMLMWGLLHEAKSRDVAVVLSGYGGDQTLSSIVEGYPRELLRSGRLVSLSRVLQQYRRRYPAMTYRWLLRTEIFDPHVPEWVRRLRHVRTDPETFLDGELFPIDHSFARSVELTERLHSAVVSRPPLSHRDLHHRAVSPGESTFNLERSNMASAATGVEMRFPFLDRRLVEYCLALPTDQKIRDGLDRSIARRALERVLPPSVRYRDTKMEFSQNVVHSVRQHELDRIWETLFEESPLVERYADLDELRTRFERFPDEGDVVDARSLLMATTLEHWLRQTAADRSHQWTPVST